MSSKKDTQKSPESAGGVSPKSPTAFALMELTPAEEAKIRTIIMKAVS
jgi:hypothetical protein